MKEYSLKSVRPLGDNDPKYGQTFWCETYDQPEPVMFNLVGENVGEGACVSAETVELKTSAKGTSYHRLKKVKILPSRATSSREAALTPQLPPNDTKKTLELILENTSLILEAVKPKSLGDTWRETTKPDNVVEDIGDEPMNLDDIPF